MTLTAFHSQCTRLLAVRAKKSFTHMPSNPMFLWQRVGCFVPVPLSKERILAFDKPLLPVLTSAIQAAQPPVDGIPVIMSNVA